MFKLIIVLMLIGVIGSLFSALFFLFRDSSQTGSGDRLVKALTLRVGLSIGLIVALLLAYRFGLIPGYA